MARGGVRHKVNLDYTIEDFNKLSIKAANEVLDRLAKRYNQRIKSFYKADPYNAQKIYEFQNVNVGNMVFPRKKAKNINEARERFAKMYKFSQSKYSSITTFKKARQKAMNQLAENVGLVGSNKDSTMSNKDKELLTGFFDYIYQDLKMDKAEYNYREIADFFSSYKLTEKEKAERLEDIKEAWRNYSKSNQTLAMYNVRQRQQMIKEGIIKKGDNRPFSMIIREEWEKENKE